MTGLQLDALVATQEVDAGWRTGPCECLACGWCWVGVWPLGADPLECKQCGSNDTVREEAPDG